ncbi:MAG: hypothetical protein AB1568_14025 [Thermodesulfobacteriota bacterium]
MIGRCCTLLFLLVGLAAATPAWPGQAVTARYEEISGTRVTLVVEIGDPPPAMIIIEQEIPAGLTLLDASPPFNKMSGARSSAKWLLKDAGPGRQRILMQFSGPVDARDLRSELRFRVRGTESSEMITVTP